MPTQYAFESASELARLIRDGDVSSLELLEMYLARIAQYNGEINAIILIDETAARARATEADLALARGESWGPLHGVPMTVKEAFDLKGMPTTWGAVEFRDNIAAKNSATVDALLNAGAVIFGKTNVPYMLADWQSHNKIYGSTSNPWDLTRSPGGSSGGAGAALAAGMTGLELGSDIGSSIRNPAHFCGLFGHKPSFGVVPQTGHGVPGGSLPLDILVCGPLARSAEDLALAMDVLVMPEPQDASAFSIKLSRSPKTTLKGFRAAAMLSSPICAVDDTVTGCLETALSAIEAAGGSVDRKARPDFDVVEAYNLFIQLLRAAGCAPLPDETFALFAADAASLPAKDTSYRAAQARGATQSYRQWYGNHLKRQLVRDKWAEFFTEYDVLLCPVAAVPAFPHDQNSVRYTRRIEVNGKLESYNDQMFWAGLASLSYLPATVIPAGRTASGLPVGLQIIGPYLADMTTIEYGRLVSEVIGGFVPPPRYA